MSKLTKAIMQKIVYSFSCSVMLCAAEPQGKMSVFISGGNSNLRLNKQGCERFDDLPRAIASSVIDGISCKGVIDDAKLASFREAASVIDSIDALDSFLEQVNNQYSCAGDLGICIGKGAIMRPVSAAYTSQSQKLTSKIGSPGFNRLLGSILAELSMDDLPASCRQDLFLRGLYGPNSTQGLVTANQEFASFVLDVADTELPHVITDTRWPDLLTVLHKRLAKDRYGIAIKSKALESMSLNDSRVMTERFIEDLRARTKEQLELYQLCNFPSGETEKPKIHINRQPTNTVTLEIMPDTDEDAVVTDFTITSNIRHTSDRISLHPNALSPYPGAEEDKAILGQLAQWSRDGQLDNLDEPNKTSLKKQLFDFWKSFMLNGVLERYYRIKNPLEGSQVASIVRGTASVEAAQIMEMLFKLVQNGHYLGIAASVADKK